MIEARRDGATIASKLKRTLGAVQSRRGKLRRLAGAKRLRLISTGLVTTWINQAMSNSRCMSARHF
jgi:hypothetical protein